MQVSAVLISGDADRSGAKRTMELMERLIAVEARAVLLPTKSPNSRWWRTLVRIGPRPSVLAAGLHRPQPLQVGGDQH